jgi:hypothetical protein
MNIFNLGILKEEYIKVAQINHAIVIFVKIKRSTAARLRRPAGMGETAPPSPQTKTPKVAQPPRAQETGVEVPEAPRWTKRHWLPY